MTVFRLRPTCGATLDPREHGHRGPCRGCGRERDQQRPWKQRRKIRSGWEWGRLRTSFTSATRPALSAAEPTACKSPIGLRSQTAARTSYRTSSSDARRTTNMSPLRAARAPRLTARRKNSVLPLASTLMAWTSEPLACPHCEAQIHAYEDVLTLFLSRVELIVVGCAACRKVLGVLPPAKVDYWPMFGRRRWALRWFPVRRKAFRGADLPGGARGESLPAGTRPQDTA